MCFLLAVTGLQLVSRELQILPTRNAHDAQTRQQARQRCVQDHNEIALKLEIMYSLIGEYPMDDKSLSIRSVLEFIPKCLQFFNPTISRYCRKVADRVVDMAGAAALGRVMLELDCDVKKALHAISTKFSSSLGEDDLAENQKEARNPIECVASRRRRSEEFSSKLHQNPPESEDITLPVDRKTKNVPIWLQSTPSKDKTTIFHFEK